MAEEYEDDLDIEDMPSVASDDEEETVQAKPRDAFEEKIARINFVKKILFVDNNKKENLILFRRLIKKRLGKLVGEKENCDSNVACDIGLSCKLDENGENGVCIPERYAKQEEAEGTAIEIFTDELGNIVSFKFQAKKDEGPSGLMHDLDEQESEDEEDEEDEEEEREEEKKELKRDQIEKSISMLEKSVVEIEELSKEIKEHKEFDKKLKNMTSELKDEDVEREIKSINTNIALLERKESDFVAGADNLEKIILDDENTSKLNNLRDRADNAYTNIQNVKRDLTSLYESKKDAVKDAKAKYELSKQAEENKRIEEELKEKTDKEAHQKAEEKQRVMQIKEELTEELKKEITENKKIMDELSQYMNDVKQNWKAAITDKSFESFHIAKAEYNALHENIIKALEKLAAISGDEDAVKMIENYLGNMKNMKNNLQEKIDENLIEYFNGKCYQFFKVYGPVYKLSKTIENLEKENSKKKGQNGPIIKHLKEEIRHYFKPDGKTPAKLEKSLTGNEDCFTSVIKGTSTQHWSESPLFVIKDKKGVPQRTLENANNLYEYQLYINKLDRIIEKYEDIIRQAKASKREREESVQSFGWNFGFNFNF